MLNEAEYTELFAQMLITIGAKVSLAVPEIAPVVLFNRRPDGKSGEFSHEVMPPPLVIGDIFTMVMFTIRSRTLSG